MGVDPTICNHQSFTTGNAFDLVWANPAAGELTDPFVTGRNIPDANAAFSEFIIVFGGEQGCAAL